MSVDTSKTRFLNDFKVTLQNQMSQEDATYTPFMDLREVQLYDARIQTLTSMHEAVQRAIDKEKGKHDYSI